VLLVVIVNCARPSKTANADSVFQAEAKGFNVELTALPVSGKLAMRLAEPKLDRSSPAGPQGPRHFSISSDTAGW
jgi:hypothetical protein